MVAKKSLIFLLIVFSLFFVNGFAEGEICEDGGYIFDMIEEFLVCSNSGWVLFNFEELETFVNEGGSVNEEQFLMIKERVEFEKNIEEHLRAEEERIQRIIAENEAKEIERKRLEEEKKLTADIEKELSKEYLRRVDILIYLVIAMIILMIGFIIMFLFHLLFRYRGVKEIKDILYSQRKGKVHIKDKRIKGENEFDENKKIGKSL